MFGFKFKFFRCKCNKFKYVFNSGIIGYFPQIALMKFRARYAFSMSTVTDDYFKEFMKRNPDFEYSRPCDEWIYDKNE